MEQVKLSRKTSETEIELDLRPFSGTGYTIDTGIPFFDHMLTHIAKHGQMDMTLKAIGDIEVDFHHTVEDVAIVLGQAFDQATEDMTGVKRYGSFTLPMEEVLCTVAVDIRKSPHFEYRVPEVFTGQMGTFDCELVKEFFRALSIFSRMNIHILIHYGDNKHHISEAIFKCFAKAFAIAASKDGTSNLYSTKGSL